MKKAAKYLGGFAAFLILIVVGFYVSALITARIEGGNVQTLASTEQNFEHEPIRIYLLTGPLHTDIAIPVSPELLTRFSYLAQSKLPLSHPGLKYLSFGWGSEAFYTTAGTYYDIKPSAVFTAITGDTSVMRIVGLGELKPTETVLALSLNQDQFERLVSFIEDSFQKDETGTRRFMPTASLQEDDAFYHAVGNFNIFYPCNQWVNSGLQKSGVTVGTWTPTTQSLKQSLRYFNSSIDQP